LQAPGVFLEREFRLLISLMTAEEFGVDTPRDGIDVEVNLATLVDRVMLGPALSKEECDAIIQHSRNAGLGDRICKSSLLGEPLSSKPWCCAWPSPTVRSKTKTRKAALENVVL